MVLARLGLATEITRGNVGHIIQVPLRANLLDIPLFACHEIMIRHKVDEFVEGFVACVGHNGVSQYRYLRGTVVALLGLARQQSQVR